MEKNREIKTKDDMLLEILAPLGTEIPDPTGEYADLFAYLYDKIAPLLSSEAIDTVVAEVETKTYTAEEREKYGKYCAVQAYDDGFYMGYIENQRPSFDEWWSEFQRKEETK